MSTLIMLLLLNAIIGVLSQSNSSAVPMNASLTYVGSAYSMVVYEVSYVNSTGYIIVPQGVYEGRFAGLLRLGNFVYVGIYNGLITRLTFTGYFIPVVSYEAVSVPTVLSIGNYSYYVATAQSKIPVVLRYLVFNEYGNGTLINTLPLIAINSSKPPLTIWFSYGYDCSEYMVNVTFFSPMRILPIPVVVNLQPPLMYFVSNVSIVSTTPNADLMLLEPGDIVVASTPVTAVNYSVYICHKPAENFGGNTEALYAMEYVGPVGISIPNELITKTFNMNHIGNNPINIINKVFYVLTNGRYRLITYSVGPENLLILNKGSPIDFTVVAMYVLRSYNIPARVVYGFYGISTGDDNYVFSSTTSILWDEAYIGNGWVMFTPMPLLGKPMSGVGFGNVTLSIIIGLILALPWIIGYLTYVIISHVKLR
ncbi:MAG: transglutaminase-like domain-containing protein [Vulcanisaeta sp.]